MATRKNQYYVILAVLKIFVGSIHTCNHDFEISADFSDVSRFTDPHLKKNFKKTLRPSYAVFCIMQPSRLLGALSKRDILVYCVLRGPQNRSGGGCVFIKSKTFLEQEVIPRYLGTTY